MFLSVASLIRGLSLPALPRLYFLHLFATPIVQSDTRRVTRRLQRLLVKKDSVTTPAAVCCGKNSNRGWNSRRSCRWRGCMRNRSCCCGDSSRTRSVRRGRSRRCSRRSSTSRTSSIWCYPRHSHVCSCCCHNCVCCRNRSHRSCCRKRSSRDSSS